jgi:hypothetical protein
MILRLCHRSNFPAPVRAHESSHRLLCPATPLSVLVSRFPFLCVCVLAHYRGDGTNRPYSHRAGPCFAWVCHGKHDSLLLPFRLTACPKPSLPVRQLSAQAICSVRNRRFLGSLAPPPSLCPAWPVICNRQLEQATCESASSPSQTPGTCSSNALRVIAGLNRRDATPFLFTGTR